MRHVPRLATLPLLCLTSLAAAGCGNEPTPANTEILSLNTQGDIPDEVRELATDPNTGSAPVPLPGGEGEARIDFATTGGPSGARYLVSITVTVVDAAGYTVTAAAIGNPENRGTAEAPIHSRLVQITAAKSSLLGDSLAQRTVRVSADGNVDLL